jgi:hypothetical protein
VLADRAATALLAHVYLLLPCSQRSCFAMSWFCTALLALVLDAAVLADRAATALLALVLDAAVLADRAATTLLAPFLPLAVWAAFCVCPFCKRLHLCTSPPCPAASSRAVLTASAARSVSTLCQSTQAFRPPSSVPAAELFLFVPLPCLGRAATTPVTPAHPRFYLRAPRLPTQALCFWGQVPGKPSELLVARNANNRMSRARRGSRQMQGSLYICGVCWGLLVGLV